MLGSTSVEENAQKEQSTSLNPLLPQLIIVLCVCGFQSVGSYSWKWQECVVFLH